MVTSFKTGIQLAKFDATGKRGHLKKEKPLLKRINIFWTLFNIVLVIGIHGSLADASALDGTVWMYEHESGARHYIAFYDGYHYLNSTRGGQDQPDSFWLRSVSPYFSNDHPNGSIHYRATHISPTAWAINWGNCDVQSEQATFNAWGMFYHVMIYNHNEPYILIATDWSPALSYTTDAFEREDAYPGVFSHAIFGNGL